MTPNAVVIMLLLLFLSTFLIVLGSMGDQDPRYYHCCILCSDTCPEAFTSETRSFHYIYPDWNCEDDCRYSCMHEITSLRLKNGYGVLKYYGHWPFHRCFGFEEFASVIFSLANSIPHILQLLGMLGVKSPTFMSSWLLIYPIFAVNAWSFSAIFHARKTEYTTLLDYISALLFLAYSLWIALRRAWGSSADPTIVSTVFIIGCFLLGYQCYEMIMGRVDYGSHMTVIVWAIWALFLAEKKPHRWICIICQVWFSLAALLEIFDFPPLFGLFDAHSLWHAATAPLGFLWYHFWQKDQDSLLISSQIEIKAE